MRAIAGMARSYREMPAQPALAGAELLRDPAARPPFPAQSLSRLRRDFADKIRSYRSGGRWSCRSELAREPPSGEISSEHGSRARTRRPPRPNKKQSALPDKPPAAPALPKCLSNEQAGIYRRTRYRLRAMTSRCTSLVPS